MLIASMSIPFTGCDDAKTAYALEEPKLIEVANTPKPTSDTKAPTNSSIKGITVNEKGELVTTYANGVIQTIKGLAGEKGDKGEKGDQGEPGRDGSDGRDGKDGLNGKDGIDGKDGRDGTDGRDGSDGRDGADGVVISSVSINDNGELIVTLTNGATQNAGNIVEMVSAKIGGQTTNIPEYEKVGYVVPIAGDFNYSGHAEFENGNSFDYIVSQIEVKLTSHVSNEPYDAIHKYTYQVSSTVTISNSTIPSGDFSVNYSKFTATNSKNTMASYLLYYYFPNNCENYNLSWSISCEIPLIMINKVF